MVSQMTIPLTWVQGYEESSIVHTSLHRKCYGEDFFCLCAGFNTYYPNVLLFLHSGRVIPCVKNKMHFFSILGLPKILIKCCVLKSDPGCIGEEERVKQWGSNSQKCNPNMMGTQWVLVSKYCIGASAAVWAKWSLKKQKTRWSVKSPSSVSCLIAVCVLTGWKVSDVALFPSLAVKFPELCIALWMVSATGHYLAFPSLSVPQLPLPPAPSWRRF